MIGMAQFTVNAPHPVRWTPERDERGASQDHAPRCPVKGCVVRWASGDDRLCRWHAAEDDDDLDRELARGRERLRQRVVSVAKEVSPSDEEG